MHCPQSNLKAIKLRLRLVYSLDVFSVTCGRSGVGSITTIDVRIDGTDGWLFNWIEIETGFVTSRFEGNVYVDEHETLRFFRSPMNARKSRSPLNARQYCSLLNARTCGYHTCTCSPMNVRKSRSLMNARTTCNPSSALAFCGLRIVRK